MSTFNGLVSEFPDIKIDFFRHHVDAKPPLACFLSHVHSDHLAGLESFRSPFIYCSAATREILLRLERYPCRINYAKGVLEARQQTYRHLSKVVKSLPLEAPTTLELQPGQCIQVTLFDANHCPGAVMFLIEGDGKAILYTGDVRCEPWFVNAISRNPTLIEYTCGIKTLDKIYLDTSFIENVPFQTKAEGITELLRQVSRYPKDTVFYIQSWTYGYEEVWLALSKALQSPIHVDDYKLRIYNSLRVRSSENRFSADVHLTTAAAALTGYMCGNSFQPGCLTSDQNVRLHSCESGNMCTIAQRPSVVRIQPIVARLPSGESIHEAGIGGGGEDLERDVELGILTQDDLHVLLKMLYTSPDVTEETRNECMKLLTDAVTSRRNLPLNIGISTFEKTHSANLEKMILSIAKKSSASREPTATELPNVIRFPYSRHSPYPELCHLVDTFKPRDVWPCTVSPEHWLKAGITIQSLFGKYCSGQTFAHDVIMEALVEQKAKQPHQSQQDSQATESCVSRLASPVADAVATNQPRSRPPSSTLDDAIAHQESYGVFPDTESRHLGIDCTLGVTECARLKAAPIQESDGTMVVAQKRAFDEFIDDSDVEDAGDSQQTNSSFTSALSMRHSLARHEAYERMLQNAQGLAWNPIELISTDCNHGTMEQEL